MTVREFYEFCLCNNYEDYEMTCSLAKYEWAVERIGIVVDEEKKEVIL